MNVTSRIDRRRAHLLDPIAIVGMGCRLPGDIEGPAQLWDFLLDGRMATGEVPATRWAPYTHRADCAAVLRTVPRHGSFLSDVAGFDTEFFGISPREARLMDPQQRLLLEVTWEALEHAGIPPSTLAAGDTGVFVGIGSDDYGRRLLEDLPRIEAWTGIGAGLCGAANRLSYTLDLRGPSLAVDTACSSSLVTIHLACQSLRLREIPLAIVGGVNVMASPGYVVALDAAGALAADGRSKAFDASADGYGRGEGAGVIILERLTRARRHGHRVLAVIRGSGVHQDGRTPGIMAPSREAQEHMLRRVYRQAGVSPATIDYLEAHGTGTRMGDPIELNAAARVLGADRPPHRPCLIGSIKPNIGHLEAGAGIAGLLKTVLALQHAHIPASLLCSSPTPAIDWDQCGLRVVTTQTLWPVTDHPRRAGVSSYGYGGTIAHVILEEAPRDQERAATELRTTKEHEDSAVRLFPLSAATPAGVRRQAARLATWLEHEGAMTSFASLSASRWPTAGRISRPRGRRCDRSSNPGQPSQTSRVW